MDASSNSSASMPTLPPVVERRLAAAKQALQQGDPAAAEKQLVAALKDAPRHAQILRLLGIAQGGQGRHADAVRTLRQAQALTPNDALIQNSLGNALGNDGDKAAAAAAFQRACELAPDLAPVWYNCGKALNECGRVEEALPVIERAVELAPGNADARFLLADMQRVSGRTQAAATEYRTWLATHPHSAEAWLGLANLSGTEFAPADLELMERAMRLPDLNDDDRISIRFALARGLEEAGRIDESFAVLLEANACVRVHYPWDASTFSARVAEILEAFAAPPPAAAPSQGDGVIFIVGMPRSGSSLIEQMLASHPQVDGAGELQDLPAVLHQESHRRGAQFPQWAGAATPEDWQRLGGQYLERTARWRERCPTFTDKLPDNWRHVGAVLTMLPAARVIECRRDPLETCLACFRQLFTRGGQAFSYDLDDIAAYWRDYDRASRCWQTRYPDRYRVQRYESLQADSGGEIAAILEFCGLPFDSACLRFHETRRSVRTASAGQVREPLRRDTARAARYGALLDPLRAALSIAAATNSAA